MSACVTTLDQHKEHYKSTPVNTRRPEGHTLFGACEATLCMHTVSYDMQTSVIIIAVVYSDLSATCTKHTLQSSFGSK